MQGRVHIWDSGNIIADIGTETVYYIRVLTLIYAKNGETKTYYRFNGHGDVIALANSSGAIIKRYKYDSFGVEENPGIFDTNVFRYCGEYYDIETKTIYLRARYYDAETGRFTQQDGWSYAVPGFLLSLNLYTYCGNDPVNHIDPSGHFLKKLGNKIKNTASAIGNSILQVASSAVKTVKRTVNNIVSNVKTLVNGVADGIDSAISWAKNDISTEELGTQLKATAAEVAETVSSNIVDEVTSIIEYNTDILDATYTVIGELVPPAGELIDTLKDFHYNRNDNQPIEELPQTVTEAKLLYDKDGSWIKQDEKDSLCHQHTAGEKANQKWLSSDGHREVIYGSDGRIVTAPEDIGTYNYSSTNTLLGKMGHFFVDMLPWYLWGNTPDDSTTIYDRINMSAGGFVKNLWR